MRCWLHINGQVLRFMPEDITELIPHFFEREGNWKINQVFLNEERKKNHYKTMMMDDNGKTKSFKMRDDKYKSFQESFVSKK